MRVGHAGNTTWMACVFCEVRDGSLPDTAWVLDEPEVIAFLDRSPVFKGHVLVVPRVHHETLPDLPAPLLPLVFEAVQRVARGVVIALGAQGTFIGVNNTVSQSVPHLHVHVVPRTKGDGLRGFFWPRTKYASPDEMHATAERIRSAVG